MIRPSYPFAAGRISALENSLISTDRFNRMIDSDNINEVFRLLKDTGFGALTEIDNPQDYEIMIEAELAETDKFINEISPDLNLTDIFLYRADYHNAKAFIKMRATSGDVDASLTNAGLLENDLLKNAVFKQEYVGLPKHLADAINETEETIKTKRDPRLIDVMMDKAWLIWAYNNVVTSKNDFLIGYFKAYTDLSNLLTIARAKNRGTNAAFVREALLLIGHLEEYALIDALTSPVDVSIARLDTKRYTEKCTAYLNNALNGKNIWEFEKFRDNYLRDYIYSKRWQQFSIEPVISWIFAKEAEARAVRLIMVAKLNHIPNDKISERLREIYA